MDDSFKKELDSIKAQTPISVKADPMFLVYGIVFIILGVWMIDAGAGVFGRALIVVGLIGVLGGAATFFWKSPKVKLIQAVDSFAIALLLSGLAIQGASRDSPVMNLALSGFMVWVGFSDLKEYRRLRKIEEGRTSNK